MRGPVVVASALLMLAAAPAASADVTIGSTFGTAPLAGFALMPEGLTAAPDGATAPTDGVITRWRVRVGSPSTPVRLRVLRPGMPSTEVARSAAEQAPPLNSTPVYKTRIPVAQGDQIALECCGSLGGAFFVMGTGQSTAWSPPLGDGAQILAPGLPLDTGTALSADLELDADTDGYGDETQDNCVGIANDQQDLDRDGQGDACDADDDGDGVADASDACPAQPAPTSDGCTVGAPPPPAPRVNTPPVVRFKTPLAGTRVGPVQQIELDAVDDAGAPVVTVFDDDGTICTLRASPYSCTWRPTGADVGRATLLASGVDSDNRSTLGIVRVTVARFEADLTRRVRGRRVTGRLVLPSAVEAALGCRGEVTVRRGRVHRTVGLKRSCSYSARLPKGRGKVRARFAGNPVVEPAT